MKLHEAKSKTQSIKLFHSLRNKSNLHFSPYENSRKLWLWDRPVIGERTITIRKERAVSSSQLDFAAEKNELQAKNSMISETIKCHN